ncbi:unnamed protein product [Bodo saltans]|uniref:Uncharacterized protein n=1 Tax=Bodo saltans TaxID=75058 RepID=A0A0S4JCM7_BODSA|nr:unnamed protein product [Bodo saltans]|eukprot:CUG86682.1 unnamed protein product [Bodo saltans]
MRWAVLTTIRPILTMQSGVTEGDMCPHRNTDSYIDNFLICNEEVMKARMVANMWCKTCAAFNVTLNPLTVDENGVPMLSQEFEFRGIRFFKVEGKLHCHVVHKTIKKLLHAFQALQNLTDHNNYMHWDVQRAESAFGLCVYASMVLHIPTHEYYYVYKYIRRIHRKVALFDESRAAPANIWPSRADCSKDQQ